ncbi:hypothetical protein [Mycolicibacterium vulneris]|nr:hypothetical protein [Mycolicibacterium vulneris]
MSTLKRINAAWRSVVVLTAGAAIALALQSCNSVRNLSEGVSNPMTPEQSKAQVVNAAREIATTLGLKAVSGHFSRDSCNDQAVAPFRGIVGLAYDHAPTLEASKAEIQQMIATLKQHGWGAPGDFHTHASAVSKQGVTAVFDPYSPVQNSGGSITIYGECRDMTTKANMLPEPIPPDQLA